MAYDTLLADRVRMHLTAFTKMKVEEKKMFSGVGFMVNDKMCVNVAGEKLMCRFDPALTETVAGNTAICPW